MGNKIVKCSSRYSGPSGDSRPSKEIFDGIEERAQQSQKVLNKLRDLLDETLKEMTLSSHQSAVESIKNTFLEWWCEHDIDVKLGFNRLTERNHKVREILFKAKGRDNGEWVEGHYVLCCECHYILPIFNNDAPYHGYDEDEWIEIEPSTICQYTGLKDKNGRKIWDNDILKQSTSKKHWCQWTCFGIVRCGEFDFRPDTAGFKTKCFYVERLNIGTEHTAIYSGINQYDVLEENYPSEVIGNVFDNPELLNPQNCHFPVIGGKG